MNLREAKKELIEHGYTIRPLNEGCYGWGSKAMCGAPDIDYDRPANATDKKIKEYIKNFCTETLKMTNIKATGKATLDWRVKVKGNFDNNVIEITFGTSNLYNKLSGAPRIQDLEINGESFRGPVDMTNVALANKIYKICGED